MSTYRISQLAERAGVPATTLRYYEREGLLPTARTSSGYRQYTDIDRERVRFIVAAKHLGLPLNEIRELVAVWAGGMCRDVRDELHPRVSAQIATADDRIADLQVFRDRLVAALDRLRELPAKEGPCDPACLFLTDPAAEAEVVLPIPRVAACTTGFEGDTVIGCSLDAGAYRERLVEWEQLLDVATITALADGGRVARFPADRAGEVARLVVAEQQCCPFFSFRLDFDGDTVELVAHAPDGAEALVAELFGRGSVELENCPC